MRLMRMKPLERVNLSQGSVDAVDYLELLFL